MSDLQREIRKLAEYVKGDFYGHIRIAEDKVLIPWHMPHRHGAVVSVHDSGRVQIATWMESGHNGDSYDNEIADVADEEKVSLLATLRDHLLAAALERAETDILRERAKEAEERRRKEARAYLLAKGVIDK